MGEETTTWTGVLIRIHNEAFTGLSYSVPGWKCDRCGAEIGSKRAPPSKCFSCGIKTDENPYSSKRQGGDKR